MRQLGVLCLQARMERSVSYALQPAAAAGAAAVCIQAAWRGRLARQHTSELLAQQQQLRQLATAATAIQVRTTPACRCHLLNIAYV